MREQNTGWLCSVCGVELCKLHDKSYLCPKCSTYWGVPDDNGICPVCFSGLIAVGKDGRICSNPKCATWNVGISHNKTSLALESDLNFLFLDNVFFEEDQLGILLTGYNPVNKRFAFMNKVIKDAWQSIVGINVSTLPEQKHKWS